jgi:glycosyltransferase involved in cell wall biosynthesis
MNINFISAINTTGYGTTALNILKGLSLNNKVSFFSLTGGIECNTEEDVNIVRMSLENAQEYDVNAPCIKLWLLPHIQMFVGRGEKIGFPIFELDKFTKKEKINSSALDTMYVCSNWAKNIVEDKLGHKNVKIVNLGQNIHKYPELLNVVRKPGPFRFFTCGKWEKRKGHDVVCEAFNKAFNKTDNVELHLMCGNHTHLNQEQEYKWKNMFITSKLGSKVRFVERVPLQEDVFRIMSQMDCGLFLSRAEGWNLELMEMICLDKTVIATNYSAHTEYCNNENSLLVDIDSMEIAIDDKWFDGKVGNWASLGDNQIDQIVNYMREVYNGRETDRSATKLVREKYTWGRSVESIERSLQQNS